MSTTTSSQSATRKKQQDAILHVVLWLYFLTGLGLSFVYDTQAIALASGSMCLLSYYIAKHLLPASNLYQYVSAVLFGVFSAQYIYQMHGLFEMHFMFFVGSALLIIFKNWKLQLPLLLFVVLHHGIFAYLQYTGMKEIYFTQLAYMDLTTFMFHAVIAGIIIGINAVWAFSFERQTRSEQRYLETVEKQLQSVNANITFANDIANGNLNADFGGSDDDTLARALKQMRDNLVVASRREELERYVTSGVAIIGDILRKNANNMQVLSDALISQIVRYTKSNQGAVFLLRKENGEDYLHMEACYAYERKKFIDRRVDIGSTLVGQCFLEQDVVHLKTLPKDYIKITSGLGMATPSAVVLIPLKSNEKTVGVIELASFHQFDEVIIEFLRKASEAIATTILSARATDDMALLLRETELKNQTVMAKEQQMRGTVDELTAREHEVQRKYTSAKELVDTLTSAGVFSVTFDEDGNVVSASDNAAEVLGYDQAVLAKLNLKKLIISKQPLERVQQLQLSPEAGARFNDVIPMIRGNGAFVNVWVDVRMNSTRGQAHLVMVCVEAQHKLMVLDPTTEPMHEQAR